MSNVNSPLAADAAGPGTGLLVPAAQLRPRVQGIADTIERAISMERSRTMTIAALQLRSEVHQLLDDLSE